MARALALERVVLPVLRGIKFQSPATRKSLMAVVSKNTVTSCCLPEHALWTRGITGIPNIADEPQLPFSQVRCLKEHALWTELPVAELRKECQAHWGARSRSRECKRWGPPE